MSRDALCRASLRLALGAMALLAVPSTTARAQSNTAETLASAVRLYEDLQVERAVVLLRQVISPNSPYEVSRGQRIQAYKYLGAALAVLGQRDSAVVYLRAALERDPFVDMDPQSFSGAERAALAQARLRTFAAAVRPVEPVTIDPRTDRMTVTVLTTHAARLNVTIRGAGAGAGDDEAAVILDADNDGLREVPWSGVLSDGRLAPPGRYVLVARGTSLSAPRTDSMRVWFDVRHDRAALEDTLPELTAADLLPERHPTGIAGRDLLRGAGVAAAALLAHVAVRDRELQGGGSYAAAAGATGLAVGVGSFLFRQQRRDIPANVAENVRRREARRRFNADVAARNASRVAETRLVLTPAAGSVQ